MSIIRPLDESALYQAYRAVATNLSLSKEEKTRQLTELCHSVAQNSLINCFHPSVTLYLGTLFYYACSWFPNSKSLLDEICSRVSYHPDKIGVILPFDKLCEGIVALLSSKASPEEVKPYLDYFLSKLSPSGKSKLFEVISSQREILNPVHYDTAVQYLSN